MLPHQELLVKVCRCSVCYSSFPTYKGVPQVLTTMCTGKPGPDTSHINANNLCRSILVAKTLGRQLVQLQCRTDFSRLS